jgi:multiple sugar transport system ATP-binding protein
MNFLPAQLERRDGGLDAVIGDGGHIRLSEPPPELAQRAGRPVMVGIRAENIEVRRADEGGAGGGTVPARVLVVEPLGSHNLVTLALGDARVKATTRPDHAIEPDEDVSLAIDSRRIRWLDAETGTAIGPAPEPHAADTPA